MELEVYKRRSKAFKALGHPTRLFIVEALNKGPSCVCDLQKIVGYDMSTVSKHLSVLREAGLVTDKRKGNLVYYSLTCPCILDFLRCMERALVLQDQAKPCPMHNELEQMTG